MDTIKKSVMKLVGQLPETTVFIVAARAVKGGQIEFEFCQSRGLAGRKASLLALANKGDARFNSGRTTMRVWFIANEEGFTELFPNAKDNEGNALNFGKIAEMCKTLADDERVALFSAVTEVSVNGILQPVKIVCRETVDVEQLPKSVRTQLQDPDVDDSIKERYILQTGGEDSERITDQLGNTVYRVFDLQYGDATDVLVADKVLESERTKTGAKASANNMLAGALNEE